jgi:hypothetical protein
VSHITAPAALAVLSVVLHTARREITLADPAALRAIAEDGPGNAGA